MRALLDEHKVGRTIVVSREPRPRTTEDRIEILPWQVFCKMLWGGEITDIRRRPADAIPA